MNLVNPRRGAAQRDLPLVAVDLDDVLVDFIGFFFDWHNRRYGTALQRESMGEGYLWTAWGGTKQEAAERVPAFFREVDQLEIEPISGARETLAELKSSYRFGIISARVPSASIQTQAWIERYFPDLFDQISLGISNPLAGHKLQTKADACKQFGASILIEDQLRHAQACAREGVRVLLFGEYPWNRANPLPEGVVRAKDWQAVRSLLVR